VVDAGVKRLGTDWGDPAIADVEAEFVYTAEEHAVFRLLGGPVPAVGSRVALVPGHVCTTLTRYRSVLACRDGAVERTLAVDGRDPLD
jgi:D-serine deaminase-like pyridoxal phosphate-dependent protein